MLGGYVQKPGEELGSYDILLYTVGLGGQVLLSSSVISIQKLFLFMVCLYTLAEEDRLEFIYVLVDHQSYP